MDGENDGGEIILYVILCVVLMYLVYQAH